MQSTYLSSMQIQETLSSNSLFHFTDSAENLISILKNNAFHPRQCLEDFGMFQFVKSRNLASDMKEFAIPMVCFCDIPLSKIKHHLSVYGKYGLGLKKTWGIKNGISPILYLHPSSETTSLLNKLLVFNYESDQIKDLLYKFLRFTKPYEGEFFKTNSFVRYYDEREWRYVPELKFSNSERPWMTKEDFLDEIKRSERNHWLSQVENRLTFEISDLSYIVVEKEKHVASMFNALTKSAEFNSDLSINLASKILTRKQIMEDF